MISAVFAIPGDLDLPTGGYAYDRRVLALLPGNGVGVRYLKVPGSYPAPSEADLAATQAVLAGIDAGTPVLVDGLALGAIPVACLDGARAPIVALCHHPLALEAGLAPERAAYLHACEQAALARARHVVVTSPSTARLLTSDFGVSADRITVAEPGTDRAERALGSGRPELQLLAVGSIVPRKGYDVLVTALEHLADLPWRLVITGADDRSPETTRKIRDAIAASGLADRIDLRGAADVATLERLYAEADVFVMPSLFEGYGMVLGEAMARGLPIVCTTGGAAAETVPDDAALKVPPGDPAALAGALRTVLTDTQKRARMADASWAGSEGLPRWADTARIIADVLRKVAP
ncbi:MAG: glycosyltransferase family 4 protein [Hyphomicrobiaceae bacterium]